MNRKFGTVNFLFLFINIGENLTRPTWVSFALKTTVKVENSVSFYLDVKYIISNVSSKFYDILLSGAISNTHTINKITNTTFQ